MESQKLYPEVRKISQENVSLLSIRDHERNTLNIAVADKDKVLEVKIILDNINMLDKIDFHKQTSDIMYNDLLQSILSTKKMEAKIGQLEWKLKQEMESNKGWKTELKKLEVDLIVVTKNPKNVHPLRKLLDDKDKKIEELKKKLKFLVQSIYRQKNWFPYSKIKILFNKKCMI